MLLEKHLARLLTATTGFILTASPKSHGILVNACESTQNVVGLLLFFWGLTNWSVPFKIQISLTPKLNLNPNPNSLSQPFILLTLTLNPPKLPLK